ncbi:imidazole glycerol phosphate synthase subunit HisH [Balneolaceae bacterium ANBcel3]|nr:imidazole glycerol phosphate synthase subunit HisH [Balneolaceae bacterium ANBcel3]
MIAIIDYKAGNLASVSNAMNRLMARYQITNDIKALEQAQAVIFPGVGHAGSAMQDLRRNGLDEWLKHTKKPVLGICLGMQLLFESTTEGSTHTLGIIPGKLERFSPALDKVPHMGWNTVSPTRDHPLLASIEPGTHFYHVHSYFAPVTSHCIARSEYSAPFAAAVAYKNFTGVQFHPEKSGKPGEQLLRNFLNMAYDGPHSMLA